MSEPTPSDRSSETSALLDYGFNTYQIDDVLSKDTIIGKSKVSLGKKEEVEVVPIDDISILREKNSNNPNITYKKEVQKLKAPLKVGDIVGKVKVYNNKEELRTIDLTVKEDVPKVGFFKALLRNFQDILKGNMNV